MAGLPVGEPVKATAGRRALTYTLGGPDAGAFVVDASTGQINTRDGVAYDHEVRPRHELTVEATAGQDVAQHRADGAGHRRRRAAGSTGTTRGGIRDPQRA